MSILGDLEKLARDLTETIEEALFGKHHHRRPRLAISISLGPISVEGHIMAASLNTSQKVPLTAGYVDANGNSTNVTPPPGDTFTWAIDASGNATLDNTTGTTVNLVAVSPTPAGSTTNIVTLTDSAGLTAATLSYTIVADVATGLTITVGTPTQQ